MSLQVVKVCAPNDNQLNPRRLWVVESKAKGTATLIAIIDEGFSGVKGIPKRWRKSCDLAINVNVTAREYDSWISLAIHNKKIFTNI